MITVFILAFFTNYFYSNYVQGLNEKKFWRAAFFGELVVGATLYNTKEVVESWIYIVPVLTGGFFGTLFSKYKI